MATILNFTPKQRIAISGAEAPRTSGAAIIIFPGVRYERVVAIGRDDADDHDGPQDTPRRKRKI